METKNRQQILVIVTLAMLGLFLANLVVYEPLSKWWKSRQTDINTLSQQVKQGKTLIRRESVIRGEWNHIRSNSLPNDPPSAWSVSPSISQIR